MKLRSFLGMVLLLAAVPVWSGTNSEPAAAPAAPAVAALVAAAPQLADELLAPQLMTPAHVALLPCLACREYVPMCQSPGLDGGKACGDGDPPNTCTCKKCGNDFGCYP